ncbi:NADP-dependent oxidoreductase [Cohaesibacter celericrescens]|uniref:NADP-dependent oxidoreductase n=1 Tax=Cohaesibacter celericrescens TaxID=2067669 RepID=A0A2N5XV63_9HYPH|nr:NADP-dependent oxidoreductase [Cohaesibacter celericrescens]PLW78403.1 NADP-dependent oxidoreductase [Cohaesibacter celericrescens]
MTQSNTVNRKLILAQRPVGAPDDATLRLETDAIPEPAEGQMLLRTVYLSLDPYMRGRMSDAKSYAEPVAIGGTMIGGTVARVVKSNVKGFEVGDWVLSFNGWQDYALSDGTMVTNMGKNPEAPSWALGVLGMPGLTAYAGLLKIGDPKPGETVVVAAATGAVGSQVGQIAKIKGARAVGIASGAEKCAYAVDELGFDACIDRFADDFAEQLAANCPAGIDVYFENVGGAVFKAVLPLLNANARIPLCGLIAMYNATQAPEGPDMSGALMSTFLVKKIKVQGFIVFDDFGHVYPEFSADMMAWIKEGKIKYREHLVEGLENAPSAFLDLLEGRNFGKMVIKVAEH